MEHNADSQGDESSYQEQSYYEGLDGSLQDQDAEYQGGDIEQRSPLREQDRFLPIANVAKIMKRAVPGNGKVSYIYRSFFKIAKDAKECVQEAAEKCQAEKRKTINGEDILSAMNILGFDNYIEPLRAFLVKFRELSKLESSYIEETPISNVMSTANPGSTTVILTPSLMPANATNITTMTSRSLAGRQFAVLNGSGELSGTPVSTSLGTAIILPISTSLNFVGGTATPVSLSDQTTDSVS